MKNLFYKELRLAMHPVNYVFIILFPLMILIPNYPLFVGFIYVCACYPILFLGANKGKQSNDIVYSVLLPIPKRDVIKARMLTLSFMQLVSFLITSALVPLAIVINNAVGKQGAAGVGISFNGYVSVLAFAVVAYAFFDFIYLVCFYKSGRSVLLPTLLGIFIFCAFLFTMTVLLPFCSKDYLHLFNDAPLWEQFIFLLIGLAIYVLIHLAGYLIAKKEFEKVDL